MKILASHELLITVQSAHIDELGHVNNVQYLGWVQDIARAHWEKCAHEKIRNEVYWVVVNHFIAYKRPSFLGNQLKVRTQVADDLSGATWGRHVWFYNESEQVVVEANTQWCLIDKKSGRPKRISKEVEEIFISHV